MRSAQFAFTLRSWSRAQAGSELQWEWICSIEDEEKFGIRPSLVTSPYERWQNADTHASRLRSKMGMDAVSYAGIEKDLGLAAKATGEALGRMDAAGAVIAARRSELPAGDVVTGAAAGHEGSGAEE